MIVISILKKIRMSNHVESYKIINRSDHTWVLDILEQNPAILNRNVIIRQAYLETLGSV